MFKGGIGVWRRMPRRRSLKSKGAPQWRLKQARLNAGALQMRANLLGWGGKDMNAMESDTVSKIIDKLIDYAFEYGPKLVAATVMLIAGLIVARWVGKLAWRSLARRNLEPPVKALIVKLVRVLVLALTMVMVLEKVGVAIAPLIAGIGVAGVGIGLAMQGVLANIVAGLTIIFTKPFRVGEYLELVGVHGEVLSIELFSTTLTHADRSLVVIPNRKIVGEILHNYGMLRQLDLTVGVAYGTDLNVALGVVNRILAGNARVVKDPAPVVGTAALADSSINLAIKPWVKLADYVPAQAEINKAVIEHFREAGIAIPFPQREVRLLNVAADGSEIRTGVRTAS